MEEYRKKGYVLYFGRFSDEKEIGTLNQTTKEFPDIQFVFAGTGALEKEIQGVANIKNVGLKKGEN